MEDQIRRIKIRETRKVSIGAVIVFALLISMVALYVIGTDEGVFQSKFVLKTIMPQTGGLQVGGPVLLAGVNVGNVTNISFIDDEIGLTKVEVTFQVRSSVKDRIKKNSRTFIGTIGLLGDKYLGITAENINDPSVREYDILACNPPIDFEQIIQKGIGVVDDLTAGARNLSSISAKIDTGSGTAGLFINNPDMYIDLDKTFKLINSIGEKVNNNQGTIGRLFNDPSVYTNLGNALKNLSATLDTFQKSDGTVKMLLTNKDLYFKMTNTLTNIDSLILKIQNGNGTAGALISNDELHKQLINSINKVDTLINDFMAHPRKYINLKVSLF